MFRRRKRGTDPAYWGGKVPTDPTVAATWGGFVAGQFDAHHGKPCNVTANGFANDHDRVGYERGCNNPDEDPAVFLRWLRGL